MNCLHGVEKLERALESSVVSIGNFDGLHKGHRVLISQMKQIAERFEAPSVVLTFHPHPLKVLRPEVDLRRLFPIDDLARELEAEGVEYLILQPFSRAFSQVSSDDFLREYLSKNFNPKAIVVGHDFGFGQKREGSVTTLEKFCQQQNIELNVIAPVTFREGIVSSSRIRELISVGQVQAANELLGRTFYVKGVVEHGDGRGKSIGFPTANVRLLSETLPKAGVYVTDTLSSGRRIPSVTNIGKNPTFLESKTGSPLRLESHLIDFQEDIYGREVEVHFHQFVRDEKKFSSVDKLISQIGEDKDYAIRFHKTRGLI